LLLNKLSLFLKDGKNPACEQQLLGRKGRYLFRRAWEMLVCRGWRQIKKKKRAKKKGKSVILSAKVSQPENYTEPIIARQRCQKRGE